MPNRSRQPGTDPLLPPHMGEGRRRSGEDLISGLPDELLHGILVRLRCARAAARASVLSRRWRHVWAHLPELHLDKPASSPDAIDGALAGYLAPALERLSISPAADRNHHALAGRAAPWLRFAAERVAGELRLHVPGPLYRLMKVVRLEPDAELELPVCGRAQRITLILRVEWQLRLRPAGLFAALTALTIHGVLMEGGELSNLVCTRCPRLIYLNLLVTLVATSNVTIRSDFLRSLQFEVLNTQRLELVAPRLEMLAVSQSHRIQAHISAPKLAQLVWNGGPYEPCDHLFPDVCRRLRLLEMNSANSASLVRRFDEVDVLKLRSWIPQGTPGYQGFLNETERLPKCKTLNIFLLCNHHGLVPSVLHLLRSCNGTRRLLLTYYNDSSRTCSSSCPCCLEESRRIDGIDLDSLNEVEISTSNNFHEGLEFVELLFRCNAGVLKKLAINYEAPGTPEAKEVCEKVHSMCPPNFEVKFYVFPDGPGRKRVRFDRLLNTR